MTVKIKQDAAMSYNYNSHKGLYSSVFAETAVKKTISASR